MKGLLSASASACLLATTVSGCYWLAAYEDLTSGLDAGLDVDVPVQDSDVAPVDATDATDATDAGSDVRTTARDGQASVDAGPFCPPDAGPLTYCMDFDGVDAASLMLGTSNASAVIDSKRSVSPPSSLHVSLFAAASSGGYGVQFPFRPVTSRLEFQVFVVNPDQWVTTLSIALDDSASQTFRVLNVVVGPNEVFQVQEYFSLSDGGSAQNGHPGSNLDGGNGVGGWHHVVLTLTSDDAKQEYLSGLAVDGEVIESDQPLGLSWAQGTASLGVGVSYGGGPDPQFYFDNVRADFGL